MRPRMKRTVKWTTIQSDSVSMWWIKMEMASVISSHQKCQVIDEIDCFNLDSLDNLECSVNWVLIFFIVIPDMYVCIEYSCSGDKYMSIHFVPNLNYLLCIQNFVFHVTLPIHSAYRAATRLYNQGKRSRRFWSPDL